MALITVSQGEPIESALRRFKRRVILEWVIQDVKQLAHFLAPTQKANLMSKKARKRKRKMRSWSAIPTRGRTETTEMSGEPE